MILNLVVHREQNSGGGPGPFVLTFYGEGLCPAVDLSYRLMMKNIILFCDGKSLNMPRHGGIGLDVAIMG